MKKIFTLSMALAFAIGFVFGQNGTADAKKILDGVSAKFRTYKTVQSTFSLKIENASGKVLGNKTGTVYMKGNKYRVSVTGQEIFSDGVNVWTYDKAANEVTITKIDPSANSITPQKLFTNFYDRDFTYKLTSNTAASQQIELTPVDKAKAFNKVLVTIKNSNITSTKVFEKAGNRYTYSTSKLTPNVAISDAMFVFDAKKFPGVEIVDLR